MNPATSSGRGDSPRPPASSRLAVPSTGMVRLLSGDFFGLEGRVVEVQVDVARRGKPCFTIVGLPGKSIRESRERIQAALRNARFFFPYKERITVNLAPAAERKDGAGYDLAVALGILVASGQIRPGVPRHADGLIDSVGLLGELGLSGELRPVPGALLAAHALRERGVRRMIVAKPNAREAATVRGLSVLGAVQLEEVARALAAPPQGADELFREIVAPAGVVSDPASESTVDFSEVRGQEIAKRGLLVSAAGEHNVLMFGPPGVGKTMLARRLPGILPPLEYEEAMEVTRVFSALGQPLHDAPVRRRPFRAPHHTISYAGLVGGGSTIRPGEVTRAHRGVLFLDELPEFHRRALEALREPLEEGAITIGRSQGAVTYPARFLLLAAMNPCPCGWLGSRRPCSCSPATVRTYAQRISGPLLDRFDLFLHVREVQAREILAETVPGETLDSDTLTARVVAARSLQARRWGVTTTNGRVEVRRLLRDGRFRGGALRELQASAEALGLSARAFGRTIRVARTLADLDESPSVEVRHVHEALHYRDDLLREV